MTRYDFLVHLLNNDPYQLQRTAKCNACKYFTYRCSYCGFIHNFEDNRAHITDKRLFFQTQILALSQILYKRRLTYNKFNKRYIFDIKTYNTIKLIFGIDLRGAIIHYTDLSDKLCVLIDKPYAR